MPRQIPTDLITQVRIQLRAESGLGSYNPDDLPSPPPPDLPSSLEESIADFDGVDDGGEEDVDVVRCEHCKARLLRGVESMICVYCGRGRRREPRPVTISFNESVAFRWLIESLGLDGSEMVAPMVDDNQTNRRQSFQNDGVSLSDFLNLEMEWSGDWETFGANLEHDAEMPGRRLWELAGVEFRGPFVDNSKGTLSAPTEQVLPNDTLSPIESAVLQRQRSFDLSENKQSTEASIDVDVVEQADSFSGWEADFQSASSDAQCVDAKSFGPSSDHASHIDSEYGFSELTKGSSNDVSVSEASTNNWIADEPWRILSSGETLAKTLETNVAPKENTTFSLPENTSSSNLDWFDNLRQTSSSEVPGDGIIAGEDLYGGEKGLTGSSDAETNHLGAIHASIPGNENSVNDSSLDAWDDFAGFAGASDNQAHTKSAKGDNRAHTSSVQRDGDDLLDAWDDFTSSSIPQDSQLQTRGANADRTDSFGNYSDDAWDSFTSFACASQNQQTVAHEQHQDDPLGIWINHSSFLAEPEYLETPASKSIANDTPSIGESAFDLWNALGNSDLKHGTRLQNDSMEIAEDKMTGGQNIADEWGDFMSLNKIDTANITEEFKSKGNSDEDESFDVWNDFTSSTNLHDDKATAKDIKVGTWDSSLISESAQLKNVEQASESKRNIEGDDTFDSWGDFSSSVNMVNDLGSFTSAFDESKVNEDIFSSSIPPLPSAQNSLQQGIGLKHDDALNEWSNIGSLAHVKDNGSQVSGSMGSKSNMVGEGGKLFDWGAPVAAAAFDNQLRTGGDAADQDSSENLDTLDNAWIDFTSSKVIEGEHGVGTSIVHSDNYAVNHSDPFDSWNMLMSSSGQTGDWNQSSETRLVNSISNARDVNHNSSQPDLFAEEFNKQNGPALYEVSPPVDPKWIGMKNENGNAEGNSNDIPISKDIGEVQVANSKDVESLIAQMHDLSFMLETTLSLPKR